MKCLRASVKRAVAAAMQFPGSGEKTQRPSLCKYACMENAMEKQPAYFLCQVIAASLASEHALLLQKLSTGRRKERLLYEM